MIYVGIDVAKDKHDCCILDAEGRKIYPVFTISNDKVGFDELFSRIEEVTSDKTEIKVGLEATGHYSNNLLASLVDKGFPTVVINPLHTNLYRKGLKVIYQSMIPKRIGQSTSLELFQIIKRIIKRHKTLYIIIK